MTLFFQEFRKMREEKCAQGDHELHKSYGWVRLFTVYRCLFCEYNTRVFHMTGSPENSFVYTKEK